MISKAIPMRNVAKSSFSELAKYIENPQNKQERIEFVRVTNCQQQNILDAAKYEIEPTQKLNQRSTDDKTYHFVISFRAGEHPSQNVLDAIEDRMCAALGYEDHQRVSAVHNDTDNLHIHIAINKIHPETYNIHTPFNDFKTHTAMCELLEKEFGLEHDNHKAQKKLSENKAADMERHSGKESFLGWVQRECAEQILNASSWRELHQTMQQNGLELRQKGNGFVITGPDELGVKASSVDRALSRASLEKKLGSFEPSTAHQPAFKPSPEILKKRFGAAGGIKQPGDRPPQIRLKRTVTLEEIPTLEINSGKRYQGKPLGTGGQGTSELYGHFQSEQQRLTASRHEALRLAKVRRDCLVEKAKRNGRLKRSVIKLMSGPGVNKRHLYSLVSKTLASEISRANAIYKKDRQDAYDIHTKRTWADWLQFKASKGDDEALKTLRQRNAQAARKQANIVHGDQVKKDGRIPGLKPDSVTKEGTIIYRVGESAIRDGGKLLDVSRDAGEDGLHAALLMAKHRYGNTLQVNGSFEFKKRIVAVAASRELDVKFADPELEKLREILNRKAVRHRDYIQVPFEQRSQARKVGAMWDNEKKSWFIGPYADRNQIKKFIRLNEEKNNEQRRQTDAGKPAGRTGTEQHADAGRERRSNGNVAGRNESRTGGGTAAGNAAGTEAGWERRGRIRAGNGAVAAGRQPGRAAGAGGSPASAGRERHAFKSNLGSFGPKPPPAAKNRVRTLSELSVVRIASRSEVSLSGDVHVQLDHKRTERADKLRRNMDRAGAVSTASGLSVQLAGAEKYIREREEKRLKGFDITKHRGYNSTDKGPFEYAGQRKSGSETLVLLKRDNEIVVKQVSDYTARRLSSLKVGEPLTVTPSGSVRTAKGRGR